jgi:hypothetical protein
MAEFERQGRTDHLDLILQTISTAYLTGILHMERGKGGVREGGDIVISRGQVVRATAGARQGDEALEWLLTWGNCQYHFQENFSIDLFPLSSPNISLPVTPIPDAPVAPQLQHASGPSNQHISRSFSSGSGGNGFERESRGPAARSDYASLPTHPVPVPPQESPSLQQTVSSPAPPAQFSPAQAPARPVVRVAVRTQDGPPPLALLDRFRLSRVHRHVFLLLDGKRTTRDLVRLTGHHLNDVERLLGDLERTGLVRWKRS